MTSFLRVRLGGGIVGIPATAVQEIVRAVAISVLPGAPPIIEGAINVRGHLVPVVDVRRRLGLPARVLDPEEFLVVLRVGERVVALRVDDVDDVVEAPADSLASSESLSPAFRGLAGVSAREDGVLVIHDPATFIHQAEVDQLDTALAAWS
jgi:purine-binding chemotaxis protein CheW